MGIVKIGIFLGLISLLSGCVTPAPIHQGYEMHVPPDEMSRRLYDIALRCWNGNDGYIEVMAIVEGHYLPDNAFAVTADWFEGDIGRTRFIEAVVFPWGQGSRIVVTEQYRTGAMAIMERWIMGSEECHGELYDW